MIPKNISIYEVGPRDGLQNEKINISLENKIKFINLLTSCNYANIEIGSLEKTFANELSRTISETFNDNCLPSNPVG